MEHITTSKNDNFIIAHICSSYGVVDLKTSVSYSTNSCNRFIIIIGYVLVLMIDLLGGLRLVLSSCHHGELTYREHFK